MTSDFDVADSNPTSEWMSSHGRAVALSYALFDAPTKLFEAVGEQEIVEAVVQHSDNDRVSSYDMAVTGDALSYKF